MLFSLGAVFVNAPSARKRIEIPYQTPLISQRKGLTDAVYQTLFLRPPMVQPPPITPAVPQQTPVDTQPTAVDFETLAWAPIPGITALKRGNQAGFATALGAVTAGTAASVYIAGQSTYSAPQMIALSGLSAYGLTVLVNHIFVQ